MEIQKIHDLFLKCTEVVIDTRKVSKSSFFIALKGANFDGNIFAKEALDKGAAFVLIDDSKYFVDDRTILVNDCLVALQELARFHRKLLNITIIGLTGSNGKTTTKELLQVVLAKKYLVKATVGNLNNHIGVPLTLLTFNGNTEIGVVEMGANHQKEIEFLCEIAQPDYGYITNFGKAHLEGFGGIDGVIRGKSEMYQFLQDNDKLVFVNLDDSIQLEKSKNIKSFSFGIANLQADVSILRVENDGPVVIYIDSCAIESQLIGLYNATNIIAAITVGTYFGVDLLKIKMAIEEYIPENNRSQLMMLRSNQIILDAYNANPSSMNAAILNFDKMAVDNKVMLLGDMFELGDESEYEHKILVESIAKLSNVQTCFIGPSFNNNTVPTPNMHFFETYEKAADFIKNSKFENSTILIKGSRGMALERLLEII